jgi:hypothetical protein
MEKKYIVTLTEEERAELQKLVSTGKAAARRLNHARILLLADAAGCASLLGINVVGDVAGPAEQVTGRQCSLRECVLLSCPLARG